VSPDLSAFWSLADEELLKLLNATEAGLDEKDAQKRLKQYGANMLKPNMRLHSLSLLFSQLKAP